MEYGVWLFYGGVAAMALSVIGGTIAAIFLHTARSRLRRRLEDEYGEKP